jgi:hypothetical protein
MMFMGFDQNKWALYRAAFQIPTNFQGNQNVQAVLFYPSCEGNTRSVSFGPKIRIQSDPSLRNCSIQDLKVSDYSVEVGESFKVGFKVLSTLQDLIPTVELTDPSGKIIFPTRLVGRSGTDLKVYEAILSYKDAYQYAYGAIARAVVENLCNASGEREVIGIMGHITSMSILKPIYPNSECSVEGAKVNTRTNRELSEELICSRNSQRGNALNWMLPKSVLKPSASEACSKLYSMKTMAGVKAICIYRGGTLIWSPENEIKVADWQEATRINLTQVNTLFTTIGETKKALPKRASELEAIWNDYVRLQSSIPENLIDTFGENIYLNSQIQVLMERVEVIAKNSASKASQPSAQSSNKSISIICVRGKKTKTITNPAPKCPAGYRKK